VFPKVVISQTIKSYEEARITNPSVVYSTPNYNTIKEWVATDKANSINYGFCSCVTFAKRLTGYDSVVGAAKNWPTNSELPSVGGVVVLDEGRIGHVAYITAVQEDSFTVSEANYISCKRSSRTLNISDKSIMGFWNPNL
jgi:surface antigen